MKRVLTGEQRVLVAKTTTLINKRSKNLKGISGSFSLPNHKSSLLKSKNSSIISSSSLPDKLNSPTSSRDYIQIPKRIFSASLRKSSDQDVNKPLQRRKSVSSSLKLASKDLNMYKTKVCIF